MMIGLCPPIISPLYLFHRKKTQYFFCCCCGPQIKHWKILWVWLSFFRLDKLLLVRERHDFINKVWRHYQTIVDCIYKFVMIEKKTIVINQLQKKDHQQTRKPVSHLDPASPPIDWTYTVESSFVHKTFFPYHVWDTSSQRMVLI